MHSDTERMNVLAARGDEGRLAALLHGCLTVGHSMRRRWWGGRSCEACGARRVPHAVAPPVRELAGART